MFCVLLTFFSVKAQLPKEVERKIDSANALKFKNWQKTDTIIKELEVSVSEKDKGEFYFKIIQIYIDANHFDEALEFCTKAKRKLSEDKQEEKLVKVDSFFAFIYAQLNDPQKAIEYYEKTEAFYENKKSKEGLIKALNNIGNAYFSLSEYDSAKYYLERSQALFKNYENPVLKAFVLSNLGKLYFSTEKYDQSELFLNEAAAILKRNHINNQDANYSANYNLANFYIQRNQPQKALFFARKTGEFVEKDNVDFDNIGYLKVLYNAYLINEDFKNSALTFKKYDSIRELMNIEEKAVNVEKIKARHEYEMKQKLDTLRQEKKNLLYIIIIVIIVLILITSLFFTINYRNKTETLNLEKKLIEAREKELEFDNHMKEKLLVHQSMEQEKVDGIFKSILEKINALKSRYQNIEEISEIINEIKINVKSKTGDDFDYHFLQIHESFYKNLEKKHPNLTNYDKKLAAMLKLRLSTKEISGILNVTPRTIENSRTRLRKKLDLTNTKEDLSKYLDDF